MRRACRWLLISLAASGCAKEPPPESVRIELPSVVLHRDAVRPVVRGRRARESITIAPNAYTLRAEPAAVATASADGTVACLKSGDAKVTVDVAGVQASAELRCRLVERLEVDELPTLDVAQTPVPLKARAVDKAGKELDGVPISVTPTNPGVVSVRELIVTPAGLGSTTLVVRAGGVERRLNVRVVKNVEFRAQPLRGGRRVDIELAPGNYEIEVELREPKELAIDWRGARQCNYRKTEKTHRSSCSLEEKGGAVVDNPSFVESGETAIDAKRITVRRLR